MYHAPQEFEPVVENHCDAWPVRRQTYSYLPSCKASPPIGWYQIILLGDTGTCVNNLPRVALGSAETGIQTCDLLMGDRKSGTLLLCHQATHTMPSVKLYITSDLIQILALLACTPSNAIIAVICKQVDVHSYDREADYY